MENHQATKLTLNTVADFLESSRKCLTGLEETGLNQASIVYIKSINTMLGNCSQSLRAFACNVTATVNKTAPLTEDEVVLLEKAEKHAVAGDDYLTREEEDQLAKIMGLIDAEGEQENA